MKEESLLLLSDLQKLINQVVLIDYTIIILGGNEVRQAEFAELSREVIPVLDKLTEIAGQHGTAEKLVSITLSAEGYIHFTVHDSGMCLSRLKREDAPELEIRKQLSQEMGREEN